MIAFRLPTFVWRALKSWWLGVTSGLRFLSFIFTLCFLAASEWHIPYRLGIYLTAMSTAIILAVIQNDRARKARIRIPSEKDIQVSVEAKNKVGTKATESDDPIETWSEDTHGRAALVDSLTIKLLISKAPVIALFGGFGSGKSSVLNLLREHLMGKAIVVSFSTWLPGSQETLTSYLLSDIASECQKEYIVPGLRKSARRIADALSETVPFLKGFLRLFPAPTQKDDIESLKVALRRLPKRVVVLLDELDRMQQDELLPLLKVVRGIASLPNLSFVCAAERETLTRTICEDADDDGNMYFEKFFPSSVPIPKFDAQVLQQAGIARIIAALRARSWFINEDEVKQYREQLEKIWPNRVAPWIRNLRAIGLLANDVSVAAAPLRREVDAVDLTLIELLRRFKPEIYDIISRNSVALTGGESLVRGGGYILTKN
jgi:predicted KAP-like P-loop ATPase